LTQIICSLCNGRGEFVEIQCRDCGGSGYAPEVDKPFAQCHTCYGEGVEEIDICPKCGGEGVIEPESYFEDFEEQLIYTFPEPQIIVSENRIITDLSLIRANIPDLIQFLAEHPRHLYEINPRDFERVIAEIFRKRGFEVKLTPSTRDGGKDIVAIHRNDLGIDTKYFIECKRYAENNKVGVEIVRALHGVKNTIGAPNKVILATTSTFTSGAIDFANNQTPSQWDIALKDYNAILDWIRSYRDPGSDQARRLSTGDIAQKNTTPKEAVIAFSGPKRAL